MSVEARASIAKYLASLRIRDAVNHSSLERRRTPDEAYFGTQAMVMAA
ncbi:hypothetical protein ACVIHA_002676 [Bradyrhizobium liaoningense]